MSLISKGIPQVTAAAKAGMKAKDKGGCHLGADERDVMDHDDGHADAQRRRPSRFPRAFIATPWRYDPSAMGQLSAIRVDFADSRSEAVIVVLAEHCRQRAPRLQSRFFLSSRISRHRAYCSDLTGAVSSESWSQNRNQSTFLS